MSGYNFVSVIILLHTGDVKCHNVFLMAQGSAYVYSSCVFSFVSVLLVITLHGFYLQNSCASSMSSFTPRNFLSSPSSRLTSKAMISVCVEGNDQLVYSANACLVWDLQNSHNTKDFLAINLKLLVRGRFLWQQQLQIALSFPVAPPSHQTLSHRPVLRNRLDAKNNSSSTFFLFKCFSFFLFLIFT